MISYPVYKLIHFFGIITLVVALAAAGMHVLRGGTRADNPYRRLLGMAHGIGAFLVLLGGFGMLARLGVVHGGLPGWVYIKLAIWLLLGGAIVLVYRRQYAGLVLGALPLLAAAAAATALYKPGS